MQSKAEFIPNFPKKAAVLRDLKKKDKKFEWQRQNNVAFNSLISKFKEKLLIKYFDINKKTCIFTDAYQTDLGARLPHGEHLHSSKSVAMVQLVLLKNDTNRTI